MAGWPAPQGRVPLPPLTSWPLCQPPGHSPGLTQAKSQGSGAGPCGCPPNSLLILMPPEGKDPARGKDKPLFSVPEFSFLSPKHSEVLPSVAVGCRSTGYGEATAGSGAGDRLMQRERAPLQLTWASACFSRADPARCPGACVRAPHLRDGGLPWSPSALHFPSFCPHVPACPRFVLGSPFSVPHMAWF